MGEINCNGARIAYDDAGSGGPPVVLIHGGAFCDRRHMRPLFDHFAPKSRTVALDLRGHGDSERVGPISNEQFADDVAAICRQLDLQTPVVIGHSTGGHTALERVSRASPAVFADLIESDLTWDGRQAAERCPADTPVLLIVSDEPFVDTEEFKELCPQAMIGRTVGSGHFHQLVVPNQVLAMIERFLDLSSPPAFRP